MNRDLSSETEWFPSSKSRLDFHHFNTISLHGSAAERDALAQQIARAVLAIDEQFQMLDDPNDMPDEVLMAIASLLECV